MGMKEAFETFFEEMTQNSIEKTGFPPKLPCNEAKRPTGLFLLDTLDKQGYAEWKPKLQEKAVSFEEIEKELGFSIHTQIKEYLSTYWFIGLEGKIQSSEGRVSLSLSSITPYSDINDIIRRRFDNEETHYLSDHKYFLIGTYCKIDGNDEYVVQVNNDTGEVTAVDVMDKYSVKLANSIEELLMNMKGMWI